MRADILKELDPITYGKSGIKFLSESTPQANACCFPLHWHERMEILRVLEGSLELRLGNETYLLDPGKVAIVDPRQLHGGFTGDDGVKHQTLMFDIAAFLNDTPATKQYLQPLLDETIAFCDITDHPAVVEATDALIAVMQTPDVHPLAAIGELYRLFGALCEHCTTVPRTPHHDQDQKFSSVLDHINNHYTDRLSASELCRQFNYSEAYFCRLFKKRTGLTVTNYIRILRLELAQRLLKQEELDINTIAARCGFADTAYFCNCFHRQFNRTPTEFRRQLAETAKQL